MTITVKSRPEDFKVQELAQLPFISTGPFAVYLLEKSGWNTIDALREISKELNIPPRLFSYGGKKDRHAQTEQFVSIEHTGIKDFTKGPLRLTFVGFMDRPMGPDLIEGNRFEVAIRRLAPKVSADIFNEAEHVRSNGFVNYFDDQRFGSYDEDQGFLAEKLLLGHFNGAVKILLTSIYPGDTAQEKKRRRFFLEHWKDWKACSSQAQTAFEKFAFFELQKGEKGALGVLNRVPREDLSMYFSAFQSFIWNEVAVAFLKEIMKDDLTGVKGITGDYLFYRNISRDILRSLVVMDVPTAAHNTRMPDERLARIYAEVLKSRSIEKSMFNKLKIRTAFFKTTDRPLVVIPKEFSVDVLDDEINPGQRKAILKFVLPRGSYATMLIKRLTLL